MQLQKSLIIHNPAAGSSRARKLEKCVMRLKEGGFEVHLHETKAPGCATERARQTIETQENYDLIIAAGGDGTISEVASGMNGHSATLGVIPLGTANVLARELEVGTSMKKAANALQAGKTKTLHAGLIGDRRFVMMAGVGFDAKSVDSLNTGLKRKIGAAAYVIAGIKAARQFSGMTYKVITDGTEHEAAAAVITNGKRYGGPFVIAPDADLSEARFDVVLMKGKGLINAIRYGLALALNKLPDLPDVDIIKARHVRIEGPDGDPVQADGDIVARLPVDITVDPVPMTIVAPDETA